MEDGGAGLEDQLLATHAEKGDLRALFGMRRILPTARTIWRGNQ